MRHRCLLAVLAVAGAAAVTSGSPNIASEPVKSSGIFNAPISIEVFSDFQCPSCKALYEQTLRPLSQDYVATGKVYLMHRDFPLPMHAHAREAACYACAAGRVGKYETACEALFRQQDTWAANGKVAEAVCSVLSPGEAKLVRELANDPKTIASVDRDIALGRSAGVNQTPTMIITYKDRKYPVTGAVSYDLLRRFLDQLLSK